MVLDILYYAKDRELDLETIEASELAEIIHEVMQSRADDLGVQLSIEVDSDSGKFKADRKAIRATLVNLIENSLDACRVDSKKEDHEVRVSVSGSDESIIFTIQDNGIGMDRETQDKAFSLFFSSKGNEGTGLGLFVADKIITSHGGNIQLVSTEGTGSTFTVELPRSPKENQNNVEHIETITTPGD